MLIDFISQPSPGFKQRYARKGGTRVLKTWPSASTNNGGTQRGAARADEEEQLKHVC